MKKIFILSFCLLSIIFAPLLAGAAIVNCDDCGINDLFGIFTEIYNIIVLQIAAPLATIAVTVGAIMMMVSAGNPNMMGNGKKIFWSGVIGLTLALGSKAIIDFILDAVGYNG